MRIKSVRKALKEAIIESSKKAEQLTGESINSLPEYFLCLSVSEFIAAIFPTFSFSLEVPLVKLCDKLGMKYQEAPNEYRISRSTRADLLLTRKYRNYAKYLVEFKRTIHKPSIKKDALRLAWICANAPAGHRIATNFLAVVTTRGRDCIYKRTIDIEDCLKNNFSNIKVKFEPINLESFKSTRSESAGKELFGGIWEIKYQS